MFPTRGSSAPRHTWDNLRAPTPCSLPRTGTHSPANAPNMGRSPWTLLMPWQLQRASLLGSCWMQVPRAGTGAWELHLPWLRELIPCEPSWGFGGSTGTPRHHFHRYSLHGGAEQEAQAVPSCHPHQPHAGTDGRSGDSVAQPPHASPQAAEGGPGGPAGSGSSQEPTSCCNSRWDGCRTSPRASPQQSAHWAEGLNPKLTHG